MTVEVRQLKDGCKLEERGRHISARLNEEGFWCSFREGEFFYRRCMDGTVVRGADAKPVSNENAKIIHRQFHQWIKRVSLNDEVIVRSQQLPIDSYDKQMALYRQAYPEDVSILPPDRYGDIVIQPAIGCPNRKCTFCAFYKEKPYQVLNKEAFISHLQSILHVYGQKLMSAQGAFLGSANAMALSQRRLMFCLEEIKERFGVFKREVATFADPDYSARRSSRDWEELRERGLKHIVIGLETGWGELRASLGKSGDLSKVSDTINSAKQSGMTIGLTVLTGAAPETKREMNLVNTLATIKGFDLSAKDIIYLSPLSDSGHIKTEAVAEQKLFAESLRDVTEARVVPYQMQRFQYFA
ncbi:radical SAM protein [Endozoicomonas sp.]|uniref:radical SAM protein n=1 Tax=Endozoicomonas sp. TaxID=1892382 RepID=UPI0028854068|nr:hypothetical protein [Endozoicomonas sp.]